MKLFVIGILFLSFVFPSLMIQESVIYTEFSSFSGSEDNFKLIWQNYTDQSFSNEWNSEIIGKNWEVGEDMLLIEDQLFITSTLYGVDSVDIGVFSHNITAGSMISEQQPIAIWNRPEFTYVDDLEYSASGDLILAGTTRRFVQQENETQTSEVYDLMVLSYDLVEKRWSNDWIWQTNDNDYTADALITSNNSLFLIGSKQGVTHRNSIIIAKINLYTFETEWIHTYEELGTEEGLSLAIGADNYLYALGGQTSHSGGEKYYLLKIQPESGEMIWSMSWGSQRINRGKSLIYGSDNNLYLTGYSYDQSNSISNVSIFKINPDNQKIIWSQIFGTRFRDGGHDIAEYNDKLIVIGTVNAPTVSGGELLILELNSKDGKILSSSMWGSENWEDGQKVIIDKKQEGLYILANVIHTNDLKSDSNILIGYFKSEIASSNENNNNNQNILFGTLFLLLLLTAVIWINRDIFHQKTKKGID